MAMVVPEQINHRRRVLYAALDQVIVEPQRVDDIFSLCDPLVRDEHFVASRVTEWVLQTGMLHQDERVPLTRALMRNMKLSYEELPKFPDDLVARTQSGKITTEAMMTAPAVPKHPSFIETPSAQSETRPVTAQVAFAPAAPVVAPLELEEPRFAAALLEAFPDNPDESEASPKVRAAKYATLLDVDPIALQKLDGAAKARAMAPVLWNQKKRRNKHSVKALFSKALAWFSRKKPAAAPKPNPTNPNPPSGKVFRAVVAAYTEAIQDTAPHFDRLLLDIAHKGGHTLLVKAVLQPWVDAGLAPPALPTNLNLPQMRAVLALLHQTACQLCGGQEANRLLQAAVKQAENLEESLDFSPRKLI